MSRPPGTTAAGALAAGRALDALPVLLALVAEGSWVAVVYALVRGATQLPIDLGIVVFAAFAGAGFLAGRALEARTGAGRAVARRAVLVVGAAGLATAVGWLADPATWAALQSGAPASALGANPGGWLTGVAFVRGIAHLRPPRPGDAVRSPMPIALPAIVAAFVVGATIDEPGRSAFRDAALVATVVFLASATLALALGRASAAGRSGGFDWRTNPAWFGLLLVVVAGILAAAVPASEALGPVVVVVIAVLPVPLLFVGLVVGFDSRLLKGVGLLLAIGVVLIVIFSLFASGPVLPETAPGGQMPAQPPTPEWVTIAWAMILLVVTAVAIGLLAALWMRQGASRDGDDVAEERSVDREAPVAAPGRRRPRLRLARRSQPTDAPTAYLATLHELAADPRLERQPDETPAEHAHRLRGIDRGRPLQAAVGLLAADYELARFGGATLTPGEHRRALARWRRVRDLVRRPGPP